jgi:GTP pyrophosphokinase
MKMQEEEKLSWLRQILEWQQDMSDNREFMSLLKNDLNLFADTVFCFTPTGDVKNLPMGSTPVDFAYSIHSAVGNKMVGAKVNDRLVQIDYQIQNGDRIEILTSQNSRGPSRDWLSIVKSTQARNKINQWFRSELKEEHITRGKELLASAMKSRTLSSSDLMKTEYQQATLRKYGYNNWDALLAAVGRGAIKDGQVINKLTEEYKKEHPDKLTDEQIIENIQDNYRKPPVEKRKSSGIIVQGIQDVSARFSKCCSPVPGDEIVGFVTRGRGISIHRTDCVNVINMPASERSRLIEADWAASENDAQSERYVADLKIYTVNRIGLLADLSRVLAESGIDISGLTTHSGKNDIATIELQFHTKGVEEIKTVMNKIRQIEGIRDVTRSVG